MDIKDTLVKKKRISPRVLTRQLLIAALSAALSCGRLPYGASPFGFAALAAASGLDVLGVSAGALLGLVLSDTPLITLGAYVLILTLRAVFSLVEGKGARVFCEHISLSPVAAATGAFAQGAYALITGELLYYHLFGLILSVVTAAVAAPLWRTVSSRAAVGGMGFWRYLSCLSLICAVCFSLRGYYLYGIPISAFTCALFTLLAARHIGATAGGVVGGMGGLCVSVIFAPSFAFCGTVCGALISLSPLLAVSMGVLVAVAWGAYINGVLAVISLFSAFLSAAVIFYVVNKLYLSEIWGRADTGAALKPKILSGDVALIRLDNAGTRLRRLCRGLSRLSGILSAEGESEERGELFEGMDGELSSEEYAGYINDILREDIPALDYRSVADYLDRIMSDASDEPFIDTGRSELLTDMLIKRFSRDDIRAVYHGKDRNNITVLCDSESFLRRRCEELAIFLSDAVCLQLDMGEVRSSEGRAYISFQQTPLLSVSVFGKKKNAVEEKSFCGDSFGVADGAQSGRFFAFINDGMGSFLYTRPIFRQKGSKRERKTRNPHQTRTKPL